MSSKRKSVRLSAEAAADSIHVVCRFRPAKNNEVAASNTINIDSTGKEVEIIDNFDKRTFAFDQIFGMSTTQEQVFFHVEGVIDSVMSGFNGTVLAYGQTSAGKSWTMEGPSIDDPDSRGVIPRSIDRLFESIGAADENLQFQVQVSYYEIYCEKIRDLLNPVQDNMKLRETKTDGFIIQDITGVYCTDRDSVLRTIGVGKANRACAPTLMNAESSRSHSILSLLVTQKDEKSGRTKHARLFLVDLAGSEKVSKTGASGLRLEEAKNINSSLTTLGMVINSLCDGSPHVPYRDSKLTRLLMESLGGNSKTTMIICCAPEARHIPETITTLRFGERAKRIKNHAKVNEELSASELLVLLHAARKDIANLKAQLAKWESQQTGNPIPVFPEHIISTDSYDESDAVDHAGTLSPTIVPRLSQPFPDSSTGLDNKEGATPFTPASLTPHTKYILEQGEDYSPRGRDSDTGIADLNYDQQDVSEMDAIASVVEEVLLRSGAASPANIQETIAGRPPIPPTPSAGGKRQPSSSDVQSTVEYKQLLTRLEEAELEAMRARAHAVEMEEELLNEKRNAEALREQQMNMSTETTALKVSVTELEERLLKATLDAKNLVPRAVSSDLLGKPMAHKAASWMHMGDGSPLRDSSPGGTSYLTKHASINNNIDVKELIRRNSRVDSSDSQSLQSYRSLVPNFLNDSETSPAKKGVQSSSAPNAVDQVVQAGDDAEDSSSSSSSDYSPVPSPNKDGKPAAIVDVLSLAPTSTGVSTEASTAAVSPGAVSPREANRPTPLDMNNVEDDELHAALDTIQDTPNTVRSATSINGLRDQSQELRILLEEEIKTLENLVTSREIETISAQATSSGYAAKYTRLREEYESYIQRLMLKLTQEQQARTQLEDKLEDAMQRVWTLEDQGNGYGTTRTGRSNSVSAGTVKRGFLGWLTGSPATAGLPGAHPSKLKELKDSKESKSMSTRELNLSRALEMSQSKASQLAAELAANKEAHSIVLDTKESVMRSLIKQNSQLAKEQETLCRRVEDLTGTVEQLTRLLRSVQSKTPMGNTANNGFFGSGRGLTRTNSNIIQGGGGRNVTKTPRGGGGVANQLSWDNIGGTTVSEGSPGFVPTHDQRLLFAVDHGN